MNPLKWIHISKTKCKSYKIVNKVKSDKKTYKIDCGMENQVLSKRIVIPGSTILCPTSQPCKMDIPHQTSPSTGPVEWIRQVYQSTRQTQNKALVKCTPLPSFSNKICKRISTLHFSFYLGLSAFHSTGLIPTGIQK